MRPQSAQNRSIRFLIFRAASKILKLVMPNPCDENWRFEPSYRLPPANTASNPRAYFDTETRSICRSPTIAAIPVGNPKSYYMAPSVNVSGTEYASPPRSAPPTDPALPSERFGRLSPQLDFWTPRVPILTRALR